MINRNKNAFYVIKMQYCGIVPKGKDVPGTCTSRAMLFYSWHSINSKHFTTLYNRWLKTHMPPDFKLWSEDVGTQLTIPLEDEHLFEHHRIPAEKRTILFKGYVDNDLDIYAFT